MTDTKILPDTANVDSTKSPVEVWNNKGIALYNLSKYSEAITAYDEAINIDPNYTGTWINKGNALERLYKLEEAIISYDQAIKIDPNNVKALSGKGNALKNCGKHEEAIISFDKALEINPKYAFAWYNKGNALDRFGNQEEAIISFDKALEIDPNYTAVWNNKGNALAKLGKHKEAITSYKEAITSYNEAITSYNEAITSYNEAPKVDPNWDYARYSKVAALVSLGKYNEAIISHDKAIKINPNFNAASATHFDSNEQLKKILIASDNEASTTISPDGTVTIYTIPVTLREKIPKGEKWYNKPAVGGIPITFHEGDAVITKDGRRGIVLSSKWIWELVLYDELNQARSGYFLVDVEINGKTEQHIRNNLSGERIKQLD